MTFELYLRFAQTTSRPDVVTNVGLLGDHQRYVVTHGARNELTSVRTKPRKRTQIFLSLLFLLQKGNWPDSYHLDFFRAKVEVSEVVYANAMVVGAAAGPLEEGVANK